MDGEPFVSLTQGDGTRAAVDAAFEPDRRKLILDTPYAVTICRMVALGSGVSVINPLVMRHLKIPGVVSLPFAPTVAFSRYILAAQQQASSNLTAAFLDCLRGEQGRLQLAASIIPLPRQFPPASRGGGPAPRWSPPA
ncbi:LysR substrate-binding domain-containing protein [Bordetella hinzii]|nr:LysR substrate-binding domain-containing protein [Bordetella hinzii]